MEGAVFSCVKELGLGFGMSVAILVMFAFVLKWLLDTTKEERIAWRSLIESHEKALEDHSAQAREFHVAVNEAHRYQREEHKQMIEALGRINGYKKE
jgi:hypothetical protein